MMHNPTNPTIIAMVVSASGTGVSRSPEAADQPVGKSGVIAEVNHIYETRYGRQADIVQTDAKAEPEHQGLVQTAVQASSPRHRRGCFAR